MTRDEACDLATRVSQTWPRSALSTAAWEDFLADLEHGRAGTAFVRLRNTAERPPTPDQFLAMYNSLSTGRRIEDCARCNGSGQLPDWSERRHGPACRPENRVPVDPVTGEPTIANTRRCACSAVRPCTCAAGAEFGQAYQTVRDSSEALDTPGRRNPPPASGETPAQLALALTGSDPGF